MTLRYQSKCGGGRGSVLSNWLVVIVVALALAGLGMAGMTSVVAKSRILSAQDRMRGLETGAIAFLDDHGTLPESFTSERACAIDGELTGTLTAKHYWELPKTTAKSSNFAPTDPFGRVYWIVFDTDGDGRVRNPAAPEGEHWLDRSVLVFSAGPDGDPTTWKDNVRNWK